MNRVHAVGPHSARPEKAVRKARSAVRRATATFTVLAAAAVAAAGCGGGGHPSPAPTTPQTKPSAVVTAAAGTHVLQGQLTDPADEMAEGLFAQKIPLRAGDALKMAVVPAGAAGANPYHEFSLGLAVDATTLARWEAAGVSSTFGNDSNPESDPNENFFSDFYSENSAEDRTGLTPYGTFVARNERSYPPTNTSDIESDFSIPVWNATLASRGLPFFWVYGGSDTAASSGWAIFVAPTDGMYTLVLGGRGGYRLSFATQAAARAAPASSPDVPPVTGAAWLAAVRAQVPFLFDFTPPDFPAPASMVSGAGDPDGPTAQVRAAVESAIAQGGG